MTATGPSQPEAAPATPLAVADLVTRFAEQPRAATARAVVAHLEVLAEPPGAAAAASLERRRYAALLARWRAIAARLETPVARRRVRWGNPFG